MLNEIFHALIFVDELFLKGRNRLIFFKHLREQVEQVVRAYSTVPCQTTLSHPVIVVSCLQPLSQSFFKALQKVPGIFAILPAVKIERKGDPFPALCEKLAGLIKTMGALPQTFRINSRRADKSFPLTSQSLNQQLGGVVLYEFPELKVSLDHAELTIEVRVFKEAIYLAVEKFLGIGGQPVGMSGHVISLISGGFDSPVASVLMSKRGCKQTLLFFYAAPFVGPAVLTKIKALASELAQFQLGCALCIVPFGAVQKEIAAKCPDEYRTLLIRLYMVKCATLAAGAVKAQALVTGDSLSQVSSQTIWHLCALDQQSPLPIFRPLIGLNKSEIITLSRKLELYEISVLPHDDACALFAPKHPIIKADPNYVQGFVHEHQGRFGELLESAWRETELIDFDLTGKPTNRAQAV